MASSETAQRQGWLRAWLWRDPDPIRAWASGQTARRIWRHPIVSAGIMAGILALLPLFAILIALGQRADLHTAWLTFAGITFGVGFLLRIVFTISVSLAPFALLGKMGGAAMLRDLALTRIDRRDLPRLFYWGSFRRQGLPALLMVYGFSIPMALTAVTTLPFPFDWTPVYLAFWACVAYLRLPLDFMMNLAISWRLLFKTGKKGLGQLYAALLLFIAFPVAHLALNAAIEWLHSELLDGWTRASDVFRLGYSEVAYVFMQAGLSAALLLGGLVLARRSAARIKGIGAAMAAGGAMAALLPFRLYAIALPLAWALSIVAALALAVRWGFRKPQRLPWLALWLGAALAIAPPESLLLGASGPRLSLGPLFLFFGGFSSGAMFLCLALKSWFALRCFRSFVAEWDQDLDERFPAG